MLAVMNKIWSIKNVFNNQNRKRSEHKYRHLYRIQYIVYSACKVDVSQITLQWEDWVVLDPHLFWCTSHFCFNFAICACVIFVGLFHTYLVDTHTHSRKIFQCSGQMLIPLSDILLALHLNSLVLHCMCIWWQILYLIYSAFLQHTPSSHI